MPPIPHFLQFFGGRSKKKSNGKGIEKKRGKMSGTVNYPKVVNDLTDVIKELNVGFAPCGAAAPSEETRRADAVGLLKALLSALEQGPAGAAAAEHGASADAAYIPFLSEMHEAEVRARKAAREDAESKRIAEENARLAALAKLNWEFIYRQLHAQEQERAFNANQEKIKEEEMKMHHERMSQSGQR